ncbi:hypothetical protein Pan44_00780 [Caulifigura coniformis]|uniref:Uncharacterized protein n=1 Tax=Caulifigura coniformis TaxID=2527983 RepID=A0A517S7H0_9PLAN|nr:hypothetical protein [Caulifigura coniformis]QDT52070.1 hypothetical protein Pan44_00780 [Caulifigura coniformis]
MTASAESTIRRPSLRRAIGVVVGIALALSTSGCAQFVLLGLLLGGPPSIEPDFDAETGLSMAKKDVKVVVVCYAPLELRYNFPSIDKEVAAQVSYRLFEHKIVPIEPDYVRAWVDQHPDWEMASEIGKAFDADYVIEIELESFSLYEEGTTTSLYRGKTVGFVHVSDMKDDGERIFSKDLDFAFPTRVPRSAYDQSLVSFKREYLSRLSEKIGFMFYEHYSGDMIGWAN